MSYTSEGFLAVKDHVKQSVMVGQTDRQPTTMLWPVYNTPMDFVHIHLLCKFYKELI